MVVGECVALEAGVVVAEAALEARVVVVEEALAPFAGVGEGDALALAFDKPVGLEDPLVVAVAFAPFELLKVVAFFFFASFELFVDFFWVLELEVVFFWTLDFATFLIGGLPCTRTTLA